MNSITEPLIEQLETQKVSKRARGVRLRPRHQEEIRAKIQASQILNVIQDHVLKGTEIAATRIHAGLALLKKVLPDAIPEAIEQNNQAQAIQAIQQAQLLAMAQEMLQQGNTTEKIVSNQMVIEHDTQSIESIPVLVSDYLQSDKETIFEDD